MKATETLSLLVGVLFLGCAACSAPRPEPAPIVEEHHLAIEGHPITLRRSKALDEIAQIEEDRAANDGDEARLISLLSHDDVVVQRRAIVALGRLPYPDFGRETTEALCALLDEPDVRIGAAFALGLRGDPLAAGVLAAYLNDVDPAMRARAVEAASRLDDPSVHRDVLVALRDADLSVKIEAALATARWDPKADNANDVDRALLDTLRPYRIERGDARTTRTAIEAELVWRILFALSRRGSLLGRGAFLEYGDSDVPLERLFAVRGLARLDADDQLVASAVSALSSTDWRIAYEATVALGRFKDPSSLDALLELITPETAHPSVHVRVGVLAALGEFEGEAKRTLPALRAGLANLEVAVRNAALVSMVRTIPAEDAVQTLERFVTREDPFTRLGVVQAAAKLPAQQAVAFLRRMATDSNRLVATSAVSALGEHLESEVRVVLHEFLQHADNGMRLAAIGALQNAPDSSDAPFLMQAFETSTGDISGEIASSVIESLGRTPTAARAQEFVRAALVDKRPYVRSVAQRVLAKSFGAELAVNHVPPLPEQRQVPLPGRDFPAWTKNPLVEISTTRGNMVFELFPAEAPKHVFNFVRLATHGEYDGLTFHRVVPDFVVQGGDYRGDGNGGRPALSNALRHEFGPRKYVRGSLGMPRNADVDSGGSQIFITHRPTPHLDGRYTIFGELLTGGDVLDQIQVGDRILSMRTLDAK